MAEIEIIELVKKYLDVLRAEGISVSNANQGSKLLLNSNLNR